MEWIFIGLMIAIGFYLAPVVFGLFGMVVMIIGGILKQLFEDK